MVLELSVPSNELDDLNWVLIRYWYYLGCRSVYFALLGLGQKFENRLLRKLPSA